MAVNQGFERRSFLKRAGLGVLAGAGGLGVANAAAASVSAAAQSTTVFDFDTPYNRVGSNCIKWDRHIGRFGRENVQVGMGIADMDFPVAPAITNALAARTEHKSWGYIDSMRPYTDVVVAWTKRRYGVTVDPDSLVLTTGVHAGVITSIQTFSPPGSKVIVQTPTYNGFFNDIAFAKCVAEENPLKLVNGRYQMDFEDLERRIGPDTHTLILCNPQNPTGNCWSREDLTTLGEICLKRRVVVLADEVHCDFVSSGQRYVPFSTIANEAAVRNSITLNSASKSFSLAGMKFGWLYSTNKQYLDKIRANHRADLSTLGLVATEAAYTGGEDWLNQVVRYIDGNLDTVARGLAGAPLVKMVKPQGTYLAWLDFSGLAEKIGAEQQAADENRKRGAGTPPVTPEQVLERYLVMNAKVQMNLGRGHGRGGQLHMRMNVAVSRRLVEQAVTNITRVVQQA